jgi:O-antigen ligase
LTIYLGFHRGGYFPGSQAFATVIVLVCLAARIAYAKRPFSGVTPAAAVVAGCLLLFALLQLLSGSWSDSQARALLEFNRTLLYLAVFVLFASVARSEVALRLMVWALTSALVIVSGAGLLSRLLPESFPTEPSFLASRLSFPLTYWNSLGVLAGVGMVFCLHLTSRARGPIAVRVLAAAALPMLATTVLLTFSRGGILATGVGLVAYALAGRSRGLVSGLLAAVPFTVLAVKTGYDADALATATPTSPQAVQQGGDVARTVVACMAGGAVSRLILVLLDRRFAAIRISARFRRRWLLPAMAATAAVLVVGAIAAGLPGYAERQYERFTGGEMAQTNGDVRKRLGTPASPARREYWKVGMREFHRAEFKGAGAGTYQLAWERRRPTAETVTDAHSLYVEILGELGILGFVLMVVAIGTMLIAILLRARGRRAPLYGALCAAALVWVIRAGADWDWEVPAVTLWFFALGGAAMAARRRRLAQATEFAPILRIVGCVAVLALTTVPVLLALSQQHLDTASTAFARGDCRTAAREAEDSISALEVRPEPYELLGYCQIRAGRTRAAVRDMRRAVGRDPRSWNYRYSLAIALATAGADPRRQARIALRLNPREQLVIDLVKRFKGRTRGEWAKGARDVAQRLRSL